MNVLEDSDSDASVRVALAAGGTGGHIMPTLALAEALRILEPRIALLFFSGTREQEIRWYGQAGVEPVQLPAAPLRRGLAGKWRASVALLRSVKAARGALKAFRPDCVVGLGSYVAGSAILAGMSLRAPFVIHEQNSVAGKANRWLAGRAAAVATTFPDAFAHRRARRVVVTGNPLRQSILAPVEREEARGHFHLDAIAPTLLVFGASQGAQRLNHTLLDLLERYAGPDGLPWQIIWITGAGHFEAVSARVRQCACAASVRVFPFIEQMGAAYAAADVVVCRASSSSLAEGAAWGRPMIAVPYPHAAEDHQRQNARFFAQAGACVVLEESELAPRRLMREAGRLLEDGALRDSMSQAALALARPDAARHLAELVLETARH